MKTNLLKFIFAVLTVGLLGSCSKINERIDGLDHRVGNIEQEKIASIDNQIAAINQSIADLGAIRNNINELQTAVGAKGEDISELQAADVALGKRIDVLEAYAAELSKYAQKDWVNATFATVEQLNATKTELSTLEETVKKLGETFDGKLADLKTELTNAIDSAISGISASISALEARVSALEKMIQTVTIVPAYSNGSVEANDGILYLDIIVEPSEAVATLTEDNLKVLVNGVKTKAVSMDTVAVTNLKVDAAKGTITARADISSKLPVENGKALTVAVNVRNGLSDYTTKFYPVTLSSNVEVKTENDSTKVTIKADADFPGSVMGNIKVEEGFKENKPTTIKVGGIGTVIFDATATGKIKDNAESAGATSVLFKVEDVTTTKPVPNADVVLEVTMKAVNENGTEVFCDGKAAGIVEIQIPMSEDVVYVNSVTLVNDAGDPIEGGVVPGSEKVEDGILTFKVNHFSKYAVDYVIREEYKAVTGVSIEQAEVTLGVGDTLRLVAAITPGDATNKKVTWSSNDTTKVKVDNTGKITAVAFGQATITVTTVDGNKTADCTVKVSETKTMADILKTTTGIPESQNLTPPANAWVNSTDPDCKAFVGVDAAGDTLFVIMKEGLSNPPAVCMDDEFEKIDDNTYKRTEPDFTFTVKMTEGKFTSLEFNTNIERILFLNGTYSAPVSSPTFKAVYNTNGGANTLTFYYDAVDHSGEGITVYDNLPSGATAYTSWGYNGILRNIKSVKIDPSVEGYKGLTSTAYMFFNMTEAESISGAEYLDVSNVKDMTYMFCAYGRNSTSLTDVPVVSGWKTDNVEKMGNLFSTYGQNSTSLPAPPDVSTWNTGNVTDMGNMFNEYGKNSTSLTAVPDVSGWKTDKVTKMGTLFAYYGDANKNNINCVLDLTGWNLANLAPKNNVFYNFSPNTFKVTIPAKTGENANLPEKWYGSGTSYFAPPAGKTFTLPVPAGALAGEFSVSATKKVYFSQGNLVATINASCTPTAWKFAANQYDCLGEGGANKTIGFAAGDVDLFGWSTDASSNNWGIHTKTSAIDGFTSGNFNDWGKNIGDGNTWRTLSQDEWKYLIKNRTMTHDKSRFSYAKDGVSIGDKIYKGVFLYPDNYNGDVVSSSMTWEQINAAGIVFLPTAGQRDGSTVDSEKGRYWSSTADVSNPINACSLRFDNAYNPDSVNSSRRYGCSVRLVADVPADGTEQYKNNSNPEWF